MKIMPENQMWRVGAQNDGLFIINAQPRPSNDDAIHDRADGPTLVLNVTELPLNKAQAICDAHNSCIKAAPTVDGEPVAPRFVWEKGEEFAFVPDDGNLRDYVVDSGIADGDEFTLEYSVTGTAVYRNNGASVDLVSMSPKYYTFPPDAAAKIAEAKLKGEEEMWLYFDKKLRYIHAHKIEWLPYEDWIKSIDKGMQELNMFRVPDAAAKITELEQKLREREELVAKSARFIFENEKLESALASHKPIFDMLSGIDDVDTTPRDGDTSFVCILKELIENERKAQKDKAELVKALEECKDDVDSWGQYASEYFKEKHDLKGCIAKYDALLTKMKGE